MTDDELLAVLHGEDDSGQDSLDMPSRQAIQKALMTRAINRSRTPHWSVVPSFWLLVASLVIAITALCVAWMALPTLVVAPRQTQSD